MPDNLKAIGHEKDFAFSSLENKYVRQVLGVAMSASFAVMLHQLMLASYVTMFNQIADSFSLAVFFYSLYYCAVQERKWKNDDQRRT